MLKLLSACKRVFHNETFLKKVSTTLSIDKKLSTFSVSTNGKATSLLQTLSCTIVPARTKKSFKNMKTVYDTYIERHRVFRFDRENAERNSCEAVPLRFYRLHWGGWIRRVKIKENRKYKKNADDWRKSSQHTLCTAKQSWLLDKMAGPWYLRKHYYVDDPYEPYHKREHFAHTREQPLPLK